ncbi:MAG TPA: amidohydrolase [Bacillota bacterium]|nr:amidohydrolase [Bacillota bacterium]
MDPKIYELAVQLRHELHQHPELSGEEFWTKARLIRFLKENTSLEIVDKGRWFYAAYRGGGTQSPVAFRADFDALPFPDNIDAPYASIFPGKGHKCGHDGHAATLAAFAMELERNRVTRDVYLIFQHAEETGAGAKECADFIPETGVKEIYAYHNDNEGEKGTVKIFRDFYACASMGMNIMMKGVPTHASTPEKGRNPALPIARLAAKLPEIADQSRFETLVMATIVEINVGDHAFGISPENGRLGVTLRAVRGEDMERLRDEIIACAEEEAEAAGVEVSFSYEDIFPDTVGDEKHAEKVRQAAVVNELPYFYADAPNRGSEDFGWFLKQCPGTMFDISCGADTPPLHSNEYDFNDEIIPDAVAMFLTLVEL